MRPHLPKTLVGWLILGYSAVGLSLLTTVLLAQLSLRELTHHSSLLVHEGTRMARLGGQLRDDVTNLERAARQFAALGDEALKSLFFQRVAKVDATLQTMDQAGFSARAGFSLSDMRERLAAIAGSSDGPGPPAGAAAGAGPGGTGRDQRLLEHIAALAQQAEAVILAGNASINREIALLQRAAERSRSRIAFSALALFPGALLILWWLLRQTRQALAALAVAIQGLGREQPRGDIAINGPQELRDLGERLDWLRRRLQELAGEKERFLRHVSHELKTPLASMKEAADLIGDPAIGTLNAQQQELRQILLEAGQDLQDQIGHLLAYAAWRREQEALPTQWFDLEPFCAELRQTFALPAGRKALELRFDRQTGQIHGHRNRLLEAMENLLSNAIKHAPAGSIIELTMRRDGGHAEFSVRDCGAGVPDDEKALIFEPFVRGRMTLQQGLPGTGVGLSIVSECILAHSGEVRVEDAQPGSRFVLRWPLPVS